MVIHFKQKRTEKRCQYAQNNFKMLLIVIDVYKDEWKFWDSFSWIASIRLSYKQMVPNITASKTRVYSKI